MNTRKNLTRWNRAGRSRFEYIDGNAVEYLEILRQQLVKQFADPSTGRCDWITPPKHIPDNEVVQKDETLIQRQQRLSLRNQRLLETYHQDRRDWAWEISRSFARCCHILTEHANAYANEAFLGTATQWDNVRRLVEILDYHPAPPASASTWLGLIAKEGKSGVIPKGFQVKNSPPFGGDKVIFETLQDVFIDALLNTLHPKGWNKSEQPIVDNNSGTSTIVTLADIMDRPVTYIQGMGPYYAQRLGVNSKIKDLLELEVGSNEIHMQEMKAKAIHLSQFAPPGDWSVINNYVLADIVNMSTASLEKLSGNTPEMVAVLKQTLRMVEVCLDHQYFQELLFRQLIAPHAESSESVKTQWYTASKPAVEPGEVAMVWNDENARAAEQDRAEAVRIDRVTELDTKPASLELVLSPSVIQYNWVQWKKGDTHLLYSPRWHKKPWLHGENVIRTNRAHGLTKDAYVGWRNVQNEWRYAKVIEFDKRNIRLSKPGPGLGTPLYKLTPIQENKAAPGLKVVVMIDEETGNDILDPVDDIHLDFPNVADIFTIIDLPDITPGSGGSLFPGALKGIGSFLFPTPFLPVDLVKAAVELMLSLGIMQIPSTGEFVIKGFPPSLDGVSGGDPVSLAESLFNYLNDLEVEITPGAGKIKTVIWNPNDTPQESKAKLLTLLVNSSVGDTPLFQQIKKNLEQKGPLLTISETAIVIANVDNLDPLYMFDSRPDRIQTGDWVVAEFIEGLYAAKIKEVRAIVDDDKTESFGLYFDNLPSNPGELQQVHADFRGKLVPYNATINLSPIAPSDFELDRIPESLKPGQQVMVTGCGDPYLTRIVDIKNHPSMYDLVLESVDTASKILQKGNAIIILALVGAECYIRIFSTEGDIVFDNKESDIANNKTFISLKTRLMPFPGIADLSEQDVYDIVNDVISIAGLSQRITFDPQLENCLAGKMQIYGNVVQAGHGETQPEKILGSGSAAKSNQEFILDVAGVSFVPDATKSAGVAAAIDVDVAGRVWEQVSSLKDSRPDDHHYETRMTEEGYVKIIFGDGTNGRRLPSGKNNVRVRFRVGSGTIGIIPKHSLNKVVKPHPLIDSISQPLPASGGGDMEDQTSLRKNAPPTLLALKRAVSLEDFSHLAASQSSIWQAKAYNDLTHDGRMTQVTVIVVPAGGVFSNVIKNDLQGYLQKQSLPDIKVWVESYQPQTVNLKVIIRVDSAAYIPQDIAASVKAEVISHFSLHNRRLGAPLYLSEIYKVVESVKGVENTICVLNDNARVVKAEDRSKVVYLDTGAGSSLIVATEEYRP